jgi:hypothetical protein
VKALGKRASRRAVLAVRLATLSCLLSFVGLVAYWIRRSEGGDPALAEIAAWLALPVSLAGMVLAISGIRQSPRLGVLALMACLVPWIVVVQAGR